MFLKALVLGLVEGTTEFLPVSSTGHLIIFGDLLNFDEEYSEVFDISIQTGALLAVVSYYKKEVLDMFLLKDVNLIRKLFLSFLPIGVLGLIFGKHILDYLFQFHIMDFKKEIKQEMDKNLHEVIFSSIDNIKFKDIYLFNNSD